MHALHSRALRKRFVQEEMRYDRLDREVHAPFCERPGVEFPRPTRHETFNTLKTKGYNLEHNFGHGKERLAAVLATMNLIAFAMHTVADLVDDPWKAARAAVGARKRFFEDLRLVTLPTLQCFFFSVFLALESDFPTTFGILQVLVDGDGVVVPDVASDAVTGVPATLLASAV